MEQVNGRPYHTASHSMSHQRFVNHNQARNSLPPVSRGGYGMPMAMGSLHQQQQQQQLQQYGNRMMHNANNNGNGNVNGSGNKRRLQTNLPAPQCPQGMHTVSRSM